MANTDLIRITALCKDLHIQGKNLIRKKTPVLRDIHLSIARGEVLGIIGLNGAGKTTLVKHILGLTRPSSGNVTIAGFSTDQPESRRNLGYLPENAYYSEHLTPDELLSFGLSHQNFSRRIQKERIMACLESTGIAHMAHKRLRTFSKGMVQRTGLALAMVTDPDLLILDEPMSGLDPLGRKMVLDLMLDLKKKGKTILFCSHILNDVERMADRIIILHEGCIRKTVSRSEVLGSSSLLHVVISRQPTTSGSFEVEATENGLYRIHCQPENLMEIMRICEQEAISVLGLEKPASSLEQLFSDTISGTSANPASGMRI
ncbi:ABC transporter ATP-binding protein [Desulfobotulus sp. H1]|uniref:ABC transporter ATP-binding protein n=1 Tax=Desulfobotulus pelophilus TaxID=2823377 RepID=A0ABT3N9Q3_9BACT|nr:ABC transporter ATP-binding protein [Desulfobotulus pelophilus]MCW7754191.1 ABC transporter ATP-binding protein [Desulfobotulus pelophilus]